MNRLILFAFATLINVPAFAADDPSIQGQLRTDIQKAMEQHIEKKQNQ